LQNLNGAVISANVVSDIELNVGYVAKDAATAQKMAEMMEKGIGAFKKTLEGKEDDPKVGPLVQILNTLKVSSKDSNTVIQGTVPRKVVDEAITKIEDLLP